MVLLVVTLILITVTQIAIVDSAKLLVLSVSNSKSHMMSNGRIADTLAEAGHNVVSLLWLYQD